MDYKIFINWSQTLITEFAKFGQWLTTPIAYLNGFTPLSLFSVGGLTLVIGFLIIRLVVGN